MSRVTRCKHCGEAMTAIGDWCGCPLPRMPLMISCPDGTEPDEPADRGFVCSHQHEADTLRAALAAAAGPELVSMPNADAGDFTATCSNCGEERDEPHTWEVCARSLAVTRDDLLGAACFVDYRLRRLRVVARAVAEWFADVHEPDAPETFRRVEALRDELVDEQSEASAVPVDFVTIRCKTCGGVAHPATGCVYSPTWIVCGPCTREAWRGLLKHINGKGGRRGLFFYEHAARTA